jgi:hypothetical protein
LEVAGDEGVWDERERPMSDEGVARKERLRIERPIPTAGPAHGDREAEASDEYRSRIAPADLAMVRAIIDAALARRS